MAVNKKHNSINDQYAQQLRNNSNTIELLTKMDQALNTNESYVTAKTIDSNGKETLSQIPTIGFFKQKLDQLQKMVKVLAGIEGNPASLQIANNQFKRIIAADINKEPNIITDVSPVFNFKTDPNWIFDSFLNPLISVEIDLTNKVDPTVKTIQSKRYIVKFETTYDSTQDKAVLTNNGLIRKTEFEQRYKGVSGIDYNEFTSWLTNIGLVNKVDNNLIDQDNFRLSPNKLKYEGNFSVLGTDIDTINRKAWYILDTLTYKNITNSNGITFDETLKVGDLVNVIPSEVGVKSTTVYKVTEISTISSQFRVTFELVFGEEPIPIRLAALSIYSELDDKRSVKVSIGYDEYCVIFIKPIDETNNLEANQWSNGVGFYTNDLRLDNNAGELFSDYYINKVNDYGAIIQDLVSKKIPNYFGIKPNSPVLLEENFKVVQNNEYLTQTVEAEKIRDLHNQKNDLTSQITQIQNSIEKQNKIISSTKFESVSDKKRAEDQLVRLQNKLTTTTQTKTTIINDILASKKNLNKISPEFSLRGYFPMPEAVFETNLKTNPQEVVQFEIWYRPLSKSGDENPILTIKDLNNSAAKNANSNNTNTNNLSKPNIVNASFSNWKVIKTDVRKRYQDPVTLLWYWQIEDVSDANTPNINQVDIPIKPGERIEFKVKSLSEVGWPETPLESDFSNTLTYDFPDNLNNVISEDEFILKEAQADEIQVNFERSLEAKGLNLHLSSAIREVDIYYPHLDKFIATSFKDANGKIINLYDQLLFMVNKINSLEETISRAKGVLEIYLVNNSNQVKIGNGTNLTFNLNLEDYMTKTKIGHIENPLDSTSRTYKNDLMIINDFSLLIKNTSSSSNLGLLSSKGYGRPTGFQQSTFAYNGQPLVNDRAIQALWLKSDSEMIISDIPSNNSTSLVTNAPRYATQVNNQWLWLQIKDINGNYIYNGNDNQPFNDYFDESIRFNNASVIHNILVEETKNLGFLSDDVTGLNTNPNTIFSPTNNLKTITDSLNWEELQSPIQPGSLSVKRMGSTIHPVISDITSITETSTDLIKIIKPGDTNNIIIPINIFAKAFTGSGVRDNSLPSNDDYDTTYPTITANTVLNTGTNTSLSGNNLMLNFTSIHNIGGNPIVKIGDKIVMDGFTNANLIPLNKKVLKVLGVLGVQIIVDYKVDSTYSQAGGFIVQVHKKYTSTYGAELDSYNVIGNNKYIDNYIEIKSKSISPAPIEHNKKLRFYLEDENNIRPIEFQLNWNIQQYRKTNIVQVTSPRTQIKGI